MTGAVRGFDGCAVVSLSCASLVGPLPVVCLRAGPAFSRVLFHGRGVARLSTVRIIHALRTRYPVVGRVGGGIADPVGSAPG